VFRNCPETKDKEMTKDILGLRGSTEKIGVKVFHAEMPDESWGFFKSHILHRLLWLSSFSPSQDPMGSCLPQCPDSSLFCKWPGNKRINFGWGIVWQLFQQMWRLLKQIQPFLGTVQFVCTSRVRLNAKLAFVHFYCGKYVFFIKRGTQDRWDCFLKLLFFSLG